MTWTALDSVGTPDPNAAKVAGYSFVAAYVGTQYQRYGTTRAYIDECIAAGIGFLPIFEEWGSQFLGGYDVAQQMMGRMRASWDRLGLPNDGSVCPAIALVDPSPGTVPGNEEALIAFARGVDDACWLPSWTGYGSRYGLDIVRPHVRKMARRWGVGTWGFGERPDGSLPPNVDADMIQHGNKHALLPGCDENTVFTENMGQLGAAPEEDDVKASIIAKQGEPYLYVWVDGYKYPTRNRLHAALMQFFGQASNGPDNPLVLSAADFDSIPNATDVFPGGGGAPAPVPMNLNVKLSGTATPA